MDLARRAAWIHPDQAKSRRAIAVPLSAAAVIVIREQISQHPTHVFNTRASGHPAQHQGLADDPGKGGDQQFPLT
ncbi:MAG TPA: hypothetical protein PLW81_10395 [Thiobacillaceae bacterium]|nr:hypothetical protein [Thiobacillaceae bacterium]